MFLRLLPNVISFKHSEKYIHLLLMKFCASGWWLCFTKGFQCHLLHDPSNLFVARCVLTSKQPSESLYRCSKLGFQRWLQTVGIKNLHTNSAVWGPQGFYRFQLCKPSLHPEDHNKFVWDFVQSTASKVTWKRLCKKKKVIYIWVICEGTWMVIFHSSCARSFFW